MMNRRHAMKAAAMVAASGTLAAPVSADEKVVKNGRIKQSLCSWCFMSRGGRWSLDRLCEAAVSLGVPSIELLEPRDFATLQKHGLVCAITSNGMGFQRGFNNPLHRAELVDKTKAAIDANVIAKFPNVIAFVGMRWVNPTDPKSGEITQDEAFKHCVTGLKEVMSKAEQAGVTICLEHLNTRDNTDPMRGHPGYQGDNLDFVNSIIKAVGSPRLKLLFDIYHVQIMHGDLIRRIDECKDWIGHIHTAGVPGRGELDENQEIQYPAVMRKLVQVGYQGYVGQEFIPMRDPMTGLRQAVALCDV